MLHMDTFTAAPSTQALEELTMRLMAWAKQAGLDRRLTGKLCIAVDEIYSNIIYYSGAGQTQVTCTLADQTVTLRFADNGSPYDPTTAPDPDTTLSAEEREIGGLGIFMVRKAASSMVYARQEGQNILTLTYHIH